jgi:hypothetical protein
MVFYFAPKGNVSSMQNSTSKTKKDPHQRAAAMLKGRDLPAAKM